MSDQETGFRPESRGPQGALGVLITDVCVMCKSQVNDSRVKDFVAFIHDVLVQESKNFLTFPSQRKIIFAIWIWHVLFTNS